MGVTDPEHGGTTRHRVPAEDTPETCPETDRGSAEASQVAAMALGFLAAGLIDEAKVALADYLRRGGGER